MIRSLPVTVGSIGAAGFSGGGGSSRFGPLTGTGDLARAAGDCIFGAAGFGVSFSGSFSSWKKKIIFCAPKIINQKNASRTPRQTTPSRICLSISIQKYVYKMLLTFFKAGSKLGLFWSFGGGLGFGNLPRDSGWAE